MNISRAPRWGLLLINLGTPDSPQTADVRRYLDEFLSDPRVLDINPVVRWLLLNLVILRTRPKESGHAYSKIWTERGSPLLFHTVDLAAGVREQLGSDVMVEIAMRYQNPSIGAALDRFRDAGVDRVVVFPLFPHYASASGGSAVEKVMVEAGLRWNVPSLQFVDVFYDDPLFIEAFSRVARPILDDFKPDYVVLSYHGLPERHCTKSDLSGNHCLKTANCCDAIVPANRFCYRAQCYATSRALYKILGFSDENIRTTFQSRLGRDPWIQPYTDEAITEIAKQGYKRVAVLCPAFVSDCLETIEEIGMRAKEDFVAAGGEDLRLIPSLNATQPWIDAVAAIATRNVPPAWANP